MTTFFSKLATASLLANCALSQIAPGTSAGEGSISGATSSPEAAGYSCDPSKCRLPSCHCASVSPPGNLALADVPMFLTLTSDDAIQIYTINAVNSFLGKRTNPNSCPVKSTYFTSLTYTNMSMVEAFYVAGNEIADHTMTHVGDPSVEEINGNLLALNTYSGIPLSDIQGFRAPFLNYSTNTLQRLKTAGFTYDSSATSSIPCKQGDQSDCFWPYTLDNGLANDCLSVEGICKGQPQLPGLWEIPMYAIFESDNSTGIHLMDSYLDGQPADVLNWLKHTFTDHYNSNKAPFGLYHHPIHLATGYPGIQDPLQQIAMINEFLDWAQQQENVWIVTNKQLLAWMRNPVPASQLNTLPEFQCQTPSISDKICNGMEPNSDGLLNNCNGPAFADFPWTTCFNCPTVPFSPENPVPAVASPAAGASLRHNLPNNCSTPFWDPIAGRCLCTSSNCAFTDGTRAIGPNGQELTGGQSDPYLSAAASSTPTNYQSFNGASSLNLFTPLLLVATTLGMAVLGGTTLLLA